MSVTTYGPDETWPVHQKPYWKVALKQARAAGWSLRHLGAPHRFGVVVCPAGDHSFSVDSTAHGAENIAKDVPKRLRECPHGNAPGPKGKGPERRAECERLLSSAERLVDTAAADLATAEAKWHALAELDRLELLLRTAELTVDDGLAAAQEEALDQALALDGAPGPDVIDEVLGQAEQQVGTATTVATEIRRATVGAPLLARADRIRSRIAALRTRLAAL